MSYFCPVWNKSTAPARSLGGQVWHSILETSACIQNLGSIWPRISIQATEIHLQFRQSKIETKFRCFELCFEVLGKSSKQSSMLWSLLWSFGQKFKAKFNALKFALKFRAKVQSKLQCFEVCFEVLGKSSKQSSKPWSLLWSLLWSFGQKFSKALKFAFYWSFGQKFKAALKFRAKLQSKVQCSQVCFEVSGKSSEQSSKPWSLLWSIRGRFGQKFKALNCAISFEVLAQVKSKAKRTEVFLRLALKEKPRISGEIAVHSLVNWSRAPKDSQICGLKNAFKSSMRWSFWVSNSCLKDERRSCWNNCNLMSETRLGSPDWVRT